MWLGVWEHNDAALGFYEHLGFKAPESHAFYIDKTRDMGLLVRCKVGPRD